MQAQPLPTPGSIGAVRSYSAAASPTTSDDASGTAGNGIFEAGSLWLDTSASPAVWWVCLDATATASVWRKIAVTNSDGELLGPIVLRTGTEAEIDAIVLDEGELAYVTDTAEVRQGDGTTAGGVLLSYTDRTIAVLRPVDNEPPATNAATAGTHTVGVMGDVPVLLFDPSTDESAWFTFFLPRDYQGGGIRVTLTWSVATSEFADVRWTVKPYRVWIDFGSSTGTAASATGSSPTPPPAGKPHQVVLTFDNDDLGSSPAEAGDAVRIQVTRDTAHAEDTATGDAALYWVEVSLL